MARPSSVEARDESCIVAQDQDRVARVDQTVVVDVRSSFLLWRERNETHGGAQAEQCVGRVDIAVAVYVAQLGGGGNDDFDLGRIAAVDRCSGDGRFADGQSRYDARAGDGRGLLVAADPCQVFDGRVVRGDDGLERDGAAHHERMRRLVKPDAGHADAFGLDGHDAAGAVVPRCRRYDGNARSKRRDLAVLTDGGGSLVAGRPADGRFCALGLQRRGQLFGLFSGVERQRIAVERDAGQAGLTGLSAGDGDGAPLLVPIGREKSNFSSLSGVLRGDVTISISPSSSICCISSQLLSYPTYS